MEKIEMTNNKYGYDSEEEYLSNQIITYLGNKRSLLKEICNEVEDILKAMKKEKVVCLDLFSGSGVVARALKKYSSTIIANDLEDYSFVINNCFLSNSKNFDIAKYQSMLNELNIKIKNNPIEGIITKNYAPKDDNNIKKGERVFYTRENAIYIDSFRYYLDEIEDETYKKYFLSLLLVEASIHVNTGGVFKGFYKDKNTGIGCFGGTAGNALSRIKGTINIATPVLSKYYSDYKIFKSDAVELSKELRNVDIAYLDPPYNQHPYGSNYFMLNLIIKNRIDADISKVSGIPNDWKHSTFNYKNEALKSLEKIVANLDSKYFIISYNNEGFITFDEMKSMLKKYGIVKTKAIKYNTYRASRNLRERDIHTNEFLFILKKRGE